MFNLDLFPSIRMDNKLANVLIQDRTNVTDLQLNKLTRQKTITGVTERAQIPDLRLPETSNYTSIIYRQFSCRYRVDLS